MLKGAVARRYAEAVMQIATESGTQDRWLADLRVIGEAFGNRQLAWVLREPKIAAARKEAILRDLLGARVQHDALNLAFVLVRDELTEIGPRLAQEYERLYNDYKGQAVAQVTTAMPLDDAERAQVTAQLGQLTGKRIILQERLDPALLGGVTARVGDVLIDGSVRRRLSLLRQQIAKGGGSFGGPADGQSDAGVPDPRGGAPGTPPGAAPAAAPAAGGSGGSVADPAAGQSTNQENQGPGGGPAPNPGPGTDGPGGQDGGRHFRRSSRRRGRR